MTSPYHPAQTPVRPLQLRPETGYPSGTGTGTMEYLEHQEEVMRRTSLGGQQRRPVLVGPDELARMLAVPYASHEIHHGSVDCEDYKIVRGTE